VVKPISASSLLLSLSLPSLNLLVTALRELAVLVVVEAPLWAKLRARRRLAIDQAEGGVFVGRKCGGEGVVAGEVENGLRRVVPPRSVRWIVKVASPVSDAAELVGA